MMKARIHKNKAFVMCINFSGGQNDDDEEDHWRIRVGRSQRRLFLYLSE